MSKMSRRTTLAMLGLAPATAVGAESFSAKPIDEPWAPSSHYSKETYARVFRSLSEQIEQGRVDVFNIDLAVTLKPDDFVKHILSVEFSYKPDSDEV